MRVHVHTDNSDARTHTPTPTFTPTPTNTHTNTARLFKLLRKAPRDIVAQKMIILDAYLPAQNCASFITSLGANVPLSTPLWLCPVAPPLKPLLLAPHGHAKGLVTNVGVYGRVCDLQAREYSRSHARANAHSPSQFVCLSVCLSVFCLFLSPTPALFLPVTLSRSLSLARSVCVSSPQPFLSLPFWTSMHTSCCRRA